MRKSQRKARKSRKSRKWTMKILECHHPDTRRRRVTAFEGDFPDVFDFSDGRAFAIALRRAPNGEDFVYLAGFVSRQLRDKTFRELRLAFAAKQRTFKMPGSGRRCPCCDEEDQTGIYPTELIEQGGSYAAR